MVPRELRPAQRTEVWIVDVDRAAASCVYTTDTVLLEAPNWAADGDGLLLNGDGLLWRLDLEPEVELSVVPIDDLPPINNDHVLDPPRGLIYMSANDGHIYVAPVTGGAARVVTHDRRRYHFLHGVSPDGTTLAFVDLPRAQFSVPGRLALVASSGGETRYPSAGTGHIDGPEYSPDGAWLYLNTEEYATRPGHAQLARVPVAGGRMERLVTSDTSTGSRTCPRMESSRATSASRRARSGTPLISTSRSGWSGRPTGATSCSDTRCSAARGP